MERKRRDRKSALIELFKPGIIFMVIITGLTGYALSFEVEHVFSIFHLIAFIVGLATISAGSFAINQAQEEKIDAQMPRTQLRPIPAGTVTVRRAFLLGWTFLILGAFILGFFVSPLASFLGLLTALLYNGFYTIIWKKRWAFGAVPGALPGAMPVVIGYAANSAHIFSTECVYMFFVMFLWQMPHFWALAIRFREDYEKGGIPVLPAAYGVDLTLYHIGLYVFVYVALAFASPWFVNIRYSYILVVVPFALKILWEFKKYFNERAQKRWLPFFMWVNVSLLVFLIIPVVEKWGTFLMSL
jgi:protoheme IX farnesyltransferase